MFNSSLFSTIMFCIVVHFSILNAEVVNISGKVTDQSGDPVSGAEVSLVKGEAIAATTNSKGLFTLVGTVTPVLNSPIGPVPSTVMVKGSVMDVTLAFSSEVNLVVYNVSGRAVHSFNSGKLNAGTHTIYLPMNRLGLVCI